MTRQNHTTAPTHPSLREALAYWLWLGCISFGGPAGQIAIMHQDLVEKKRWISERRFLHALNYCMVLPGPEATQLATYIGWLLHGKWGGLAAGSLFVLPSLFVLTLLSWLYLAFGNILAIVGILYGIKPAVTAIVLFAAWRIGQRALKNAWLWCIATAALIALFALQLPFPLIILGAAAIGALGGRMAPAHFRVGGGHQTAAPHAGPALIDDDMETPAHARYRPWRLAMTLALSLAIWGGSVALLTWRYGWDGLLPQMGWFFTKAALLTFGGAYAVLPYVFQAAVEQHHWLTATQMIDGLALGETTPGPLIMVTAFVGFVGAWQAAIFGSDQLFLAGAAGASVVTFFTFLPSFVFIFIGAPLIEATHGNPTFTAPLTAITAAVVGVVVNLALFFAWHVFWPDGWTGSIEWPAVLIFGAALLALYRWQGGIIRVIGLAAAAGLIHALL